MNEITINLDEYLSDAEKKEIVRAEFASVAKRKVQADFERIISNAGYDVVWKVVDEHFDGNAIEVLKAKVIDVIGTLTPYNVFREKDNYQRDKTVGQQMLDQAITDAYPAIKEKAIAIVDEIGEDAMVSIIERRFVSAVMDKLRS